MPMKGGEKLKRPHGKAYGPKQVEINGASKCPSGIQSPLFTVP